VDADKNLDNLEKHLKILGQKIRIDILKKLRNSQRALSFSTLQKEVLSNYSGSINLSFHLKALKNSDYINSTEEGYILNSLGKEILKNILSIEKVLNDQNKELMIRTSKYSKEPFNINKIQEYLIKEGEVEKFLARQIASKVEKRLSKTNIEYLTAPLMREYINAVLLENGLEEIRHKLTRLGTPPFEALKSFKSRDINPEFFINKLGSDASEQFLLLNLLPKDLADLYLSGEICLLNLNYWSLRPLGFYINSSSILKSISRNYSIVLDEQNKPLELILKFFNIIQEFIPFFSEDLLLGHFNRDFLSLVKLNNKISDIYKVLISNIFNFNSRYYDKKSHLSLEFSFNDGGQQYSPNVQQCKKFFNLVNSYYKSNQKMKIPTIFFDYSLINGYDFKIGDNLYPLLRNMIFFKKSNSFLLNRTLINAKFHDKNNINTNKIILDKILINLHSISLKSKQNDSQFLDFLIEHLNSVFKLFEVKKDLVIKKLNSSKNWNYLINEFFNNEISKWIDNSVKAISFFGLNQAIKNHCGIELDRTESSEKFCLKILNLLKKLINEKNEEEQEKFLLCQPHNDKYLIDSYHSSLFNFTKDPKKNCLEIIRKDSNLSIDKKINLFKKFQTILNGGILYNQNSDYKELNQDIKQLVNSGIWSFSFKGHF
jgi:hypothetical protein